MVGKFIKFFMVAVLLFTATITIAGPLDLVITTSEREARLCEDDDLTLKVFVSDTTGELTSFTYQWYYNTDLVSVLDGSWVLVPEANTSILNLSDVSAATTVGNAGYYYCRIYYDPDDDTFCRNSEKIHVDVATAIPSIESVSAPNYVCEGSTLELVASGVSGFNIRNWYLGDEAVSHGNSYQVASASLGDAGVYRFVASNACGDSVYGPFEISVVELPRITTQPRSAALCGGDNLTFRVEATGTNLQYQWYYNNAPYPSENTSATTSALLIENASHDSAFYSNTFNVQVSNVCATVTSINVGTIISEVPNIVGNPEPTTVCAGEEVTLYANATTNYPTDTIVYRWFLDGNPFEGGTTNTITFAMDSAHMGEYYCEFTNGCGTVRGNSAQVIVKMPPTVESQPIDVSVCEGEMAQLYAKITGVEPMTLIWQNSNGEGLDYTDITTQNVSGETTSTLVVNPSAETHERYYYCLATNECGSVRTDTVFLNVNQHISVYPSLPAGISLCSGVDTVISIADRIYQGADLVDEDEFEAQGITFAWHKQGETEIVSTEPYLHFSNLTDDEAGRYVCDITNACGTDDLASVLITVTLSPTITMQPHDLDVCTGGTLSLSLTAEGDGLRYAWYRNGEYLGNNSPTYTAPTVAAQYGGTYYCKVESEFDCPTAYSDTVTVTVGTTPAITMQPQPAIMALCEGAEYELAMAASGDGVHYQWYNNGNALEGQTTPNLHIDHVTRNNDGVFYCIASNACDEARTNNATLTVNNAPDMTLGRDIHACRGESVVLEPHGDEEYAHYSWNHGTYGYQPMITVTLSGTYFLEVSDSAHGNCVARDTVVVTFHDYFDIAFDTMPIVTCGEFVLDAGAGATEYMWSTTEMTSSITVGMNGYYMVTVDGDGYGCTTSAGVEVTIGEELVIDLGDDITAAEHSIVEIAVPNPDIYDSFLWNTGFTGPTLTVDTTLSAGIYTFWVRVSSGNCYASDTISVNFLEGGYVDMESMPVLNIYPNPASDYVNIVSENAEISEVQVYDMVGRLVVSRQVADESLILNVAGMVDATYFVRVIYTDGKASVSKLIINR